VTERGGGCAVDTMGHLVPGGESERQKNRETKVGKKAGRQKKDSTKWQSHELGGFKKSVRRKEMRCSHDGEEKRTGTASLG